MICKNLVGFYHELPGKILLGRMIIFMLENNENWQINAWPIKLKGPSVYAKTLPKTGKMSKDMGSVFARYANQLKTPSNAVPHFWQRP